jgi:acylphosphatase
VTTGSGQSDVVARHVLVEGRVQGVFFRASTRREARRAGVRGWVRNRADGRVEAHLEGEPDAVEGVLAWIRDGGPPAGRVEEVQVEETEPIDAAEFTIER